jgi:hypothetical protein
VEINGHQDSTAGNIAADKALHGSTRAWAVVRQVYAEPGMEIAPAQVLSTMIMNIMVSARPLYRMEDWLHDYLDGVTERRFEAAKYNDDRLGRSLDLVFDADRASLMAELSANVIRVHRLETREMHNKSAPEF